MIFGNVLGVGWLIACNLLYFRLGIFFCDKLFVIRSKMAHKLGWQNLVSRLLFSMVFTLSCTIFQFVIFGVLKRENHQDIATSINEGLWTWKLYMCTLLCFVVFVLPLYQIGLFVNNVLNSIEMRTKRVITVSNSQTSTSGRTSSWKIFVPCVVASYVAYLYLFSVLTNVKGVEANNDPSSTQKLEFVAMVQDWLSVILQKFLARISVVGVTVIALLSGFGAVNLPVSFLNVLILFTNAGKKTEQDLVALEARLDRNLSMTIMKKHQLAKCIQQRNNLNNTLNVNDEPNEQRNASSGFFGGMISRTVSYFSSSDQNKVLEEKISNLNSEISALEQLNEQLFLDVYDCCTTLDQVKFSRTLKGKIYRTIGVTTAIYCLYRLTMAFFKVFVMSRTDTRPDPVTRFLSYLTFVFHMSDKIDLVAWSQQLSFLFIGWIIVLSIRSLLLSLQRVSRLLFSTISTSTMIVFFSQIMGTYFIASVMLLRQNLPISQRSVMASVLHGMQFLFYEQWFDILFIISASITLVYFVLFARMERFKQEQSYID